jgi:hypothetical protein
MRGLDALEHTETWLLVLAPFELVADNLEPPLVWRGPWRLKAALPTREIDHQRVDICNEILITACHLRNQGSQDE